MAKDLKKEMTIEEARAYRLAQYKASDKKSTDQEKREAFRIFWAQEKAKYGQPKELENVVWAHLKATEMDSPEKFNDGIKSFGLKISK